MSQRKKLKEKREREPEWKSERERNKKERKKNENEKKSDHRTHQPPMSLRRKHRIQLTKARKRKGEEITVKILNRKGPTDRTSMPMIIPSILKNFLSLPELARVRRSISDKLLGPRTIPLR